MIRVFKTWLTGSKAMTLVSQEDHTTFQPRSKVSQIAEVGKNINQGDRGSEKEGTPTKRQRKDSQGGFSPRS
jgi:hypothetical protein